jgi:hypothetical protein
MLYNSCFMIWKYSSLDCVEARIVEAWDRRARNLDSGFEFTILAFLCCCNHFMITGLELLVSAAKKLLVSKGLSLQS